MWKNLYIKSFGQGLAGTARTCWTTVKLAWKAAPLLLVGVLLLFGVESGLTPLQLALSRAVIDKLAAPVGRTAALDPLVTHVPLAVWIALTLAVVALGQLAAPLTALLQSRASDRLTGYVTEQVIQAANRWQGLERFEDPSFADDLKRAREAANRGVDRRVGATHSSQPVDYPGRTAPAGPPSAHAGNAAADGARFRV